MTIDRSMHRFLMDHRSSVLTALFKLATHLGSSAVLIPLVVLVAASIGPGRAASYPSGLLASSYAGWVAFRRLRAEGAL